MNENLKLKLIQIVMLIIITLQTLTPIMQCRVIATEQMPMYVVKPTTTSQMTQAQLNTALKDAPAIPSEYTVSEPIAIYTQGSGDLVVIGVFAGIALYAAYNIVKLRPAPL